MNRIRPIALLATVAVVPLSVLAVGCGGGNNATGASSPPKQANTPPASVKVANSGLGKILVDAQGRTLYLFRKDSGTTSACTGACASAWPPLRTSGKPVVGSGANASMVGTTTRSDGKPQVTYNGHPLYTFVKDQKPGDTNGEGVTAFGGSWFVLSPAGNQISKSGSGSSSSPPAAPAAPPARKPTPRPAAPAAPPAPKPKPAPKSNGIPQNGGGDGDADNNGGPSDGDGGI
jgi:predicted lipoprotein with Yx(FWY)xxD motif